jgi:leader peptidase (prepilin peptidase) / N-methyltransferase
MNPGTATTHQGSLRARIARPLLIAVAAALVALWAAAVEADWTGLLVECVFGWGLLALAWIDWQRMRLPDLLTLPLLALGLTATALEMPDELTASVIGAIAGYAALRLIDRGYRGLRGREGLGQGDAKLLAAGGAWLGWEALPWVVLLAAALGLALALFQRARGVALTPETALPFGPPLALAIWIVRLHGFPGN